MNLNYEHVSWLGGFNLERPGQIVDLGEIDIFHVVCTIVVADLSSRPIDAFNLDNLAILDLAAKRDCSIVNRDQL